MTSAKLDSQPSGPLSSVAMLTRRAIPVPMCALVLSLLVPAGMAQAQLPDPAAGPPALTVLTRPPGVSLSIQGPTEVYGLTPMDLPSSVVGRFSFLAQGTGVARTYGAFDFGTRGEAPYPLSERSGMSASLFIRSLNYPGIPNMSTKRSLRGLPMLFAETGALTMATIAQVRYRDRLEEAGVIPGLKAREQRHVRNAWLIYGGSVWAVSAVDYWLRPRFTVHEATATRLSLGVPTLRRESVVLRSLLIPGAGQEFANHRTRGAFWVTAVLAAGAGYTVAETVVQRRHTQLAVLLTDPAPDPIEVVRLENDVRSAEDVRRGFAYGALVIYVANLVDAVILDLGPPASTAPARFSVGMSPVGPRVGVSVRY